jgi:hypothetical protein
VLERHLVGESDQLWCNAVDVTVASEPWGLALVSGRKSRLPEAKALAFDDPNDLAEFVDDLWSQGVQVRLVKGICP